MKVITLVKLAMVVAIYVIFTVFLPFSYGEIQFRVAEVLLLLCFFRKDYVYALIVGCLIANIFSPLGIIDVIFGTIHTAIAAFLISRSKNLIIASLYPTIFMFIIALELHFVLSLPFWLTLLTTMAGEFVVVTIIGVPLFMLLRKNNDFMQLIEANQNEGETHEI